MPGDHPAAKPHAPQDTTHNPQHNPKHDAKKGDKAEAKPTGLAVGEHAPAVTLKDADNADVKLASVYAKGPTVVVFYRGDWCPFCAGQLKDWQSHLDALEKAGGTLVAISLENKEHADKTIEKGSLTFRVLRDATGDAVRKFKVAFTVDPATQEKYKGFGVNLPDRDSTGDWQLPITSTYIIAPDGTIAYAWNDPDYRKRAKAEDVIAEVAKLKK